MPCGSSCSRLSSAALCRRKAALYAGYDLPGNSSSMQAAQLQQQADHFSHKGSLRTKPLRIPRMVASMLGRA